MAQYRRREIVEARQLKQDERVVTSSGIVEAHKGDYIVTFDEGKEERMQQEDFEAIYETVPKNGK